ncbi:hypothetical protein [Novosphingobium sp.]|uniref:hypothetical protein n=1 Tax=Novosphingobium sp. TaxID=1874826 RepID=UPI00263691FE|nr:hypothetical protein [Novosphingobium sp.]
MSGRVSALESKGAGRSSRWLRVLQHEGESQGDAIARAGVHLGSGVNVIVRRIV